MIILGIESASATAGAAVWRDGVILAEYNVNNTRTHSETLLPMLAEVCRAADIPLEEVDAIALSGGPGSFTGLRIGSATAKGLGLALSCPLIHIPTTDGLAYNLMGADGLVCPIMDARRGEVYTGIYRLTERFEVLSPAEPIPLAGLLEKLSAWDEPVTFLGDGVRVHKTAIEDAMGERARFAPAHLALARAGALAALGAVYFAEGKTVSAADERPDYLRLSQAERVRAEKES